MRPARYDISISAIRAEALFASPLQSSDEPDSAQVDQAVAAALHEFGARGCAARVAQAYGEHPETAVMRMRWARATIARMFDEAVPRPAHRPGHRSALCTRPAA